MELQLKIRLSLVAAALIALVSCEPGIEAPEEKSVDERFSLSEDWNRKHPFREITVQSDDYTILCGADSHVGNAANLNNFFRIATTSHTSAVLMAGDLTSGNTDDYARFKQYLPSQDSLPVFLTVGNHDLWSGGWEQYYQNFGSASYFFTVKTTGGSDLFISLDNGSGTLGNDQLVWLENVLKNVRPGYRRCIVFTHNNLFRFRHTAISNPPVEELQFLIELFTQYHVDMVLTGHDHVRAEEIFGVTTYIIIGALTDKPEPGYLKLKITNGSIQHSFENLY
jgi:3',5'-cyclic AMP phosphodiesterase CpdA